MNLKRVYAQAKACVILKSDFANLGQWVFFADESQAAEFAAAEGGRVVDEDGLARKFASMHHASGRQPNQSADGSFVEYPSEEELENLGQTEDEWLEGYWEEEYAASAEWEFKSADVYELLTEDVTK